MTVYINSNEPLVIDAPTLKFSTPSRFGVLITDMGYNIVDGSPVAIDAHWGIKNPITMKEFNGRKIWYVPVSPPLTFWQYIKSLFRRDN